MEPPDPCVGSFTPTLAGGVESGGWPLDLSESFKAGRSCARSWSNCFVDLIEFALERVDVSDLVGSRFSFVTENCAVKLIGVLTQTFLARDRAALGGGDDFLSHAVHSSVEI